MRFFIFFQVLIMILAGVSSAQADLFGNTGKWIWGPPNTDPVRPYLEEGKIPHNSQWADDEWEPQMWIEDRGSAKAVIDGFYAAGVVTDQYIDHGMPVLEVGQTFLELSGQEKRRVAAFFDHVFRVTQTHEKGAFHIIFHKHDALVGLFGKEGLQLQ